jgi:methyl-accepting chemotaxis protein
MTAGAVGMEAGVLRVVGNLGMRTKLIAMLAVPLVGLVLFGVIGIAEKRRQASDAAAIEKLTGLSSTMGAYLHESQKERGLTGLFLASKGTDDGSALRTQRAGTDRALAALRASIRATAGSQDAGLRGRVAKLEKDAGSLESVRKRVDGRSIVPSEAIGWYTGLHAQMLDAIATIAAGNDDARLARSLSAYGTLLGAKEAAGIERATLAGALKAGRFADAAALRAFVSASAIEDQKLHAFELLAAPADRAFLAGALTGSGVRTAAAIRATALAQLTSPAVSGADPKAWFAAQTARIDRLKKVEDHLSAGVRAQAGSVHADASATLKLYALLTLLAVVAGLGVGYVVVRQLATAVRTVLDRLSRLHDNCVTGLARGLGAMARGDLTRGAEVTTPPIERPGRDEVGRIATAVNEILEKTGSTIGAYNETRASLAGMIGQVSATAGTVSASSQQMSSTSEEAGRATTEIASAVGEIAVGAERQVRMIDSARRKAEEVADSTGTSTRKAQETAQAARDTRSVAEDGAAAVSRATAAMSAVRESSERATGVIRQLGAKSNEIGGIVDTITGIAGQTNLLALNAAIEAARAGEQGRGFAVVAEEVRKLAEESQRAAESIGALVGEIQLETQQAVDVVETGTSQAVESVATVEAARASFERIGASVDDMTVRVEDIVAAVEHIAAAAVRMQEDMGEIASVTEQSSASTQQVSASTQETSASTQEIAASAAELARSAEELQQLVARFQLA